ncbi:bifunctional lysylphosphatidylglycerol flippase/synthetase MprF [Nibricoccus aquaticus]|nr:phosphatidylglycerol lysyltransferase domain-containing protein [Nibricoccus aquaticus]
MIFPGVEGLFKWLRKRPPGVIAVSLTAVLAGLITMTAAIFPQEQWMVDELERWTPFHIALGSQVLLLIVSVILLSVGRGLLRGKRVAWLFATSVLAISPLLFIGQDFNWTRALAVLVPFALLIQQRKYFAARSDAISLRKAMRPLSVLALVVLVFGYLGVRHVDSQVEGNTGRLGAAQTVLELVLLQSTDTQRPMTRQAQTMFFSVSLAGGLTGLAFLLIALRPVLMRTPPDPAAVARAREIILAHGGNPLDEFALAADKQLFFPTSNRTVVAYALWRNFAVTLADPIGPAEDVPFALEEFIQFCHEQDWEPVFYQIDRAHLERYRALGFTAFKIGENARIPLTGWSLTGRKFQDMRTAINRASREGVTFHWYPGEGTVDHGIEAQLADISEDWLKTGKRAEMAFDMGAFSTAEIRLRSAAVAKRKDGRVEAFVTWIPYAGGKARCLDLMRSRHDAMPGIMDFVIVESLKHFQSRGLEEASLASAPLANADPEAGDAHTRVVRFLYEKLNKIYGYKSLFAFKGKYQPAWRSTFLAYRNKRHLGFIAYATVAVHVRGGLLKMWRS